MKNILGAVMPLTIITGLAISAAAPAVDLGAHQQTHNLIRFGVLADRTGSAKANSTPEILPEHLEPVILWLRANGGQLAVTTVTASTRGELVRLAIAPPMASKPAPPRPSASPFEQQRELTRYRAAIAAWNAIEDPRLQQADANIREFKKQLPALLIGPRTDKLSNVSAALVRLDRFFQEPLALPNYTPINLAVIASDLRHNAGGERHQMESKAVTAWLSRSEKTPEGPFHIDASFESTSPAIEWIVGEAIKAVAPHQISIPIRR